MMGWWIVGGVGGLKSPGGVVGRHGSCEGVWEAMDTVVVYLDCGVWISVG